MGFLGAFVGNGPARAVRVRLRAATDIRAMQPRRNSSAFCIAAVLIASTQHAMAQRCPPNSHPEAVAFAGSLRTAQCFAIGASRASMEFACL
jgi:hypothetical protein